MLGAVLIVGMVVGVGRALAQTPEPAEPEAVEPASDTEPDLGTEAKPDEAAPAEEEPLPPPEVGPPESIEEDGTSFYGEPPVGSGWDRGRFIAEIKAGPYHPMIDDEPGLTGKPYQAVFGSGDSVLWGFELGMAVHRGMLGWIGLSGSVGYFSDSEPALTASGGETGDDTSFTLIPTALSLVWRIDQLAAKYRLPIVPYAKLGLSSYFWWTEGGDGETSTTGDDTTMDPSDDAKGAGGTLGWQGNLGLSFVLDGVDRSSAQSLAAETGIRHLHVFVELLYARVNDFKDESLHVGDTTWMAGIAFEM